MAKENYLSLRGQLRSDVTFARDPDTGEITRAMFPLLVLRRNIKDRNGYLAPKFDRPIISTSDPDMIKAAETLRHYDIVDVKGTFLTQHSKRNKQCPCCGAINVIESPIQIVNPVYIGVINDKFEDDTSGTNYLMKCAEISNIAKIIGRVCTPTEQIITGETERGELYCRYQLAVNRKLYVLDSIDEEDHADYPLVYSYGKTASDDSQVLQQNALIYVDGYVHTVVLDQEVECAECHNNFPIKTQRMNLTPYSNEYLRDFKGDVLESTHTKQEQEPPEQCEDTELQ